MNHTKNLHAPIKYFGGKSLMWKNIIAQFPSPDYNIYMEPFSGSYTIGLHMPYIPPIEVFNDLNKNVYCLYKVLRDEEMFPKFIKMVELTPYSEDMRYDAREKLKDASLSELERAYWFYTANRLSINGIGGFATNMLVRRGMAKSVSDFLSSIDRMPELHERFKHLIVYNRDALELMDKYNLPNCFMYCDPPYVWSTRGTTRYDIDQDDDFHKKFVDKCISSKAKILISGYDNPIYKKLEENGFTKVEFNVNTIDGNRKPKTKTETLWRNYDLPVSS